MDRIREYPSTRPGSRRRGVPVIEDDVTELAREIIGDVESSFGM
ncbi:hypothetical protein [Streptomyces clavuligerus]|nr:hypothetical protein [Streptomyces clavuligerus]